MADEQLPAPLVPSEVDLRGYEYMPLYGHHLFGSDFNARVSDAGWRAALTLWWAAWNQVPAASLPADDVALTRLADLGRDVKGFRKLKPEALHGFIECDDGRLYHKTLAVWALEAWDRRVKERDRKAKWRDRARDKDVPETGTGGGTERGQEPGQRRDVPAEVKGSEGKRREETSKPAVGVTPTIDARANGSHGGEEIPETASPTATAPESWRNPVWLAASAQTVGVERRRGERDEDFADRVYTAIEARKRAGEAEATRRTR